MYDLSRKFEGNNRKEGGSDTSKGIKAKFFDCEVNVNPGIASAGDDQTARLVDSRARPWPGLRSGNEPPPHHHHGDSERVGVDTHKPLINDHLHIQHPGTSRLRSMLRARLLEFRRYRKKIEPGNTTHGRPRNRTASGIERHLRFFTDTKKSGHPVVPSTTIFERGTLEKKNGKESIHFIASAESVNIICKLIEFVNQLCIFLVITKCMDDLLENYPQRGTGEQHRTGKPTLSYSGS